MEKVQAELTLFSVVIFITCTFIDNSYKPISNRMQEHLVNKPLQAAGMSDDNVRG